MEPKKVNKRKTTTKTVSVYSNEWEAAKKILKKKYNSNISRYVNDVILDLVAKEKALNEHENQAKLDLK